MLVREPRPSPSRSPPPRAHLSRGLTWLSREAVLKALDTPPSALLDALEASAAAPDDEWRAVVPRALETIEAAKQGAPT